MSMMRFWQITLVVIAFSFTASAAETQTYRDAQGRTTGMVTTRAAATPPTATRRDGRR